MNSSHTGYQQAFQRQVLPQTNNQAHLQNQPQAAAGVAQQTEPLPLPGSELKRLLDKLGIAVEQGALLHAGQAAEQELAEGSLLQRVGAVINKLKLRGVQPLQLQWTRFDQRRLPALVWHQQQWWLAEHHGQGVELTDTAGNKQQADDVALQQATVLWLRTPAQGADGDRGRAADSPAARLVWRELFKTKGWMRDVVLATLVINLLAVGTSIFAMQVYDRVVPTLAYATLSTLVAGMVIVTVLDWFLKLMRGRIVDSLACSVDRSVSQQVFEHVMHLRLDSRPHSLGTLAAQVGGLESVRQFFSSAVIFALVDMPFALLFIIFIYLVGGPIAWVYAVLLLVALFIGVISQARLQRLAKEHLMRSNERQGLLVDVIRGCESIRASAASWRFAEQWREITHSISGYSIQQKDINNRTMNTVASLSSLAYVAAIVVGVGQIESGNLSMGALIACSILGGRVIAPVARAVQYLAQWEGVSQSLQMVDAVLKLDTERAPEQTLLVPDKAPAAVTLSDVTFSYPEVPVLQLNIPQLSLSAGDRVLLVGPIGCGKSTLLKMLAGQYRPTQGQVMLGEASLWETDPAVVSDLVGYLPQNVHLFKGSLRSNLALSGAVSDSELLNICQELGIDRIAASNPRSMELAISEGGDGLSGGQKQLVGLGRVFLGRPKLWLLDEPTASLDMESDRRVLQAVDQRVQPDDILVLSTHRISAAVPLVNRVIVMEQGTIVADGKPEQIIPMLLAKHGYAAAPTANAASRAQTSGANHAV